MEQDKRVFRASVISLVLAVIFRLVSNFLPAIPMTRQAASALLFWQTGRVVKYSFPQEEPATKPNLPLVFSSEDAALVAVENKDKYGVDVAAMLQSRLTWDLTGAAPTVLILHSHATESFSETAGQGYRSQEQTENMLSIGAYLAQKLEEGGIRCIHDTTLHDLDYNSAYASSRKSVADYLQQYPSIQLVLDLHRDSAVDSKGNHYGATVATSYGSSARLMLVMATGAGGKHPNWQENVSLAIKLQAVLEKQEPGICRNMLLRTSRYNQDLSTGALLIEVGADGNTHAQAVAATDALANAILTLAYGSSV